MVSINCSIVSAVHRHYLTLSTHTHTHTHTLTHSVTVQQQISSAHTENQEVEEGRSFTAGKATKSGVKMKVL